MKTKINFENDNILFISNEQIDIESSEFKKNTDFDRKKIREKVEPWLTAVFQSEHLSLLVGSGLPIALVDNG
jgi:tRNA(Ile)-lysidine synthase TilS/MesJ